MSHPDREQIEQTIHTRVNQTRTTRGLSDIARDSDLVAIARYHSTTLANYGRLFHETPTGESLQDRLEQFGYDLRVRVAGPDFCGECGRDVRVLAAPATCPGCGNHLSGSASAAWAGENISRVQRRGIDPDPSADGLASRVVGGWLRSPPHRETLLDDRFKREGVGVVIEHTDGWVCYVTQVLS